MSEISRIKDQLRRAVEGEAWHGPAFLEVVRDLTPQRAANRLHPATHSAWEIAIHIAVWLEVAADRLHGRAQEPTEAQDWPAMGEVSEENWRGAIGRVEVAHESLQRALDAITDDRLEGLVPGREHSIYHTVHGAIQHTLYHTGQLALLAKV